MPPWGKGPVQQKIHGHPEYINDNFPLIDKFVRCKVERLNVEKEGDVVYKADHKSDEEEFAKARELSSAEYRPHVQDQPHLLAGSDPMTTYAGVAILAVMGMTMFLVSNRKKVVGKTN